MLYWVELYLGFIPSSLVQEQSAVHGAQAGDSHEGQAGQAAL